MIVVLARAIGAAIAVFLLPHPAWSWGCAAHQAIALVAAPQLSTHARDEIDRLLRNHPIDPGLDRFCSGRGLTRFADAATWADDVRGTPAFSHTGEWHFLDIPRGAKRERPTDLCPAEGCVTKALAEQVAILKSRAKGKRKADALRFVIHLAGDIHQPLHCATNSDRGGNCVPVAFFGAKPVVTATGKASPNLHAVWDTDLVGRDPHNTGPRAFANYLTQNFQTKMPAWRLVGLDFDEWAWESHELAEGVAYGKLSTEIPVEPERADGRSCVVRGDNISKRMRVFDERIEQPYLDAAQPVIEAQLAKAGARLAMILNDVWR